jgi:hypothetical protein
MTVQKIGKEFHVSKDDIKLCSPNLICSPSYANHLQDFGMPDLPKKRFLFHVLAVFGRGF